MTLANHFLVSGFKCFGGVTVADRFIYFPNSVFNQVTIHATSVMARFARLFLQRIDAPYLWWQSIHFAGCIASRVAFTLVQAQHTTAKLLHSPSCGAPRIETKERM